MPGEPRGRSLARPSLSSLKMENLTLEGQPGGAGLVANKEAVHAWNPSGQV
jgi:hypothetical protein